MAVNKPKLKTHMEKQDLTIYGDQELSLYFENDESLYHDLLRAARLEDFSILENICDDLFIYTPEQLEDLRETYENEIEENN